jgi:hypothetical protein
MRRILTEPRYAALACLGLAVFACYANSLWGDFQFDDYNVIVFNPGVHSWGAWLRGLDTGIRPLLKFSYTLNWTMSEDVIGFHLLNIAIHLCNVMLVFALTREFVRRHPVLPQQEWGIAFLAALLFAVHPAHTEAVTYICGRSVGLMTVFYLAGMLAYSVGRTRQSSALMSLATPLCFIAALGVKETAATFPLALLAWHLACGGSAREAIKTQWLVWLVMLLGAVFFLAHGGYFSMMEKSAALNNLQGNIATQATAFFYLMRQWLLPLWLNIDPDLPVLSGLDGHWPPVLLLAGTLVVTLAVFRRRPWMGFALAWALIQLVPLYCFLPRIDVANDRQLYLVSWPLALALVAETALLLKNPKRLVVAGVALACALGVLTVLRNQDYRNEVALWESTAALSFGKARVHSNLGVAYELAGHEEYARREYGIALELQPDNPTVRDNLKRVSE